MPASLQHSAIRKTGSHRHDLPSICAICLQLGAVRTSGSEMGFLHCATEFFEIK